MSVEDIVNSRTGSKGHPEGQPKARPLKRQAKDPLDEQGLPANPEAERWILDGLFEDAALYQQAASFGLEPDDFSSERHRRIFRAMCVLVQSEEHINTVTVAEELVRLGQLGRDGIGYLVDLNTGMPHLTAECFASLVRIVLEKSTRRRGIFLAQKFQNEWGISAEEPEEILASYAQSMRDLEISSGRGRKHGAISIDTMILLIG